MTLELLNSCKKETRVIAFSLGAFLLVYGFIDTNLVAVGLGVLVLNYSSYRKTLEIKENLCLFTTKSYVYNNIEEFSFEGLSGIDIFTKGRSAAVFLIKGGIAKKCEIDSSYVENLLYYFSKNLSVDISLNGEIQKIMG